MEWREQAAGWTSRSPAECGACHHAAMPTLIDPDVRLRESFLDAAAEFRADATYPVPWYVTDIDPAALTDSAAFSAYVDRVFRRPHRLRRPAQRATAGACDCDARGGAPGSPFARH